MNRISRFARSWRPCTRTGLVLGVLLCGLAGVAQANPLAPPGDIGLRHDIRLLADAGIIKGPISTWPVLWPQIAANLAHVPEDAQYPPAVAAALARVRWHVNQNRSEHSARTGMYAMAGSEPLFLRNFADTPRSNVETGVFMDWTSGRFAGRIELSYVHDPASHSYTRPADDQEFRLDGSWAGVVMGNWMLAAGWMERYWGPGWRGGLIMSNNARPRPGITLRRIRTDPFETPWLSWMGPWQFTTFVERLDSNRAVPHALLFGMRLAFRPFESLEIGLSHTAQFGGDGNDVDFDTVINAVSGFSTSTNPLVGSAADINSLAGLDFRWHLPFVPRTAVYGEIIGEDEKGGTPYLLMSQFGIEFWGAVGEAGASWRLAFEHTDTRAALFNPGNSRNGVGVAYNNSQFPTGYRYRGRAIGYPADGDARLNSVRAIYATAGGDVWTLSAASGELNRDNVNQAKNSLTPRSEDLRTINLAYSRPFRWGDVTLGLGYTQREFDGGDKNKVHAWIGLSRTF